MRSGDVVSVRTPDGRVMHLRKSVPGTDLVRRFKPGGKNLVKTNSSDGTVEFVEDSMKPVLLKQNDSLEFQSRFYGG